MKKSEPADRPADPADPATAADLSAALRADRKSRDDLRQMWSDLADKDDAAVASYVPTILDEAERHLRAASEEIRTLEGLQPRMVEAGIDVSSIKALVALLRQTESAMASFRDEARAAARMLDQRIF